MGDIYPAVAFLDYGVGDPSQLCSWLKPESRGNDEQMWRALTIMEAEVLKVQISLGKQGAGRRDKGVDKVVISLSTDASFSHT